MRALNPSLLIITSLDRCEMELINKGIEALSVIRIKWLSPIRERINPHFWLQIFSISKRC
jgi:hypothetical protein